MDRALLERMVGAVVLVLLFVVFVPSLLDGRQDSDVVRPENIEAGVGTRTEVIVLNAAENPSPPATKADKPKLSKRQSKPVETQPKPVVEAKRQAPQEGFAVQLGSFSSRDNALGFAGATREAGYPVFVIRAAVSNATVFRVYAGPRPTREEADKLAAKLAADGRSVMVVKLGGTGSG